MKPHPKPPPRPPKEKKPLKRTPLKRVPSTKKKISYGRAEIEKYSKSKIKKDLDTIFCAWIRMRDADKDGMVQCIDSKITVHWSKTDAGHYLPRSTHPSLIFNEMNVHAQRKIDNWLEGNRTNYRTGMINRYGENKVIWLESQQNKKSNIGIFEMKQLLLLYINKFNEQAKRLNHTPNTTQSAVIKRWTTP